MIKHKFKKGDVVRVKESMLRLWANGRTTGMVIKCRLNEVNSSNAPLYRLENFGGLDGKFTEQWFELDGGK